MGVVQLVERCVWDAEAVGSSPTTHTKKNRIMKHYKELILGYFLGLITLLAFGMSGKPDTQCTPAGMGIIDLEIGCEEHYEFAVLNEELYDSLVIIIDVDCNVRE